MGAIMQLYRIKSCSDIRKPDRTEVKVKSECKTKQMLRHYGVKAQA